MHKLCYSFIFENKLRIKMKCYRFCVFFMCIVQIIYGQDLNFVNRSKRFVPPIIVFPPTAPTRIQLIFGIGIPEGDLNFESLTNGWVLKYEYFLPSNATQLYIPATLDIKGRRSIQEEHPNMESYEIQTELIKMYLNKKDHKINRYDSIGDKNYIETNLNKLSEVRQKEKKTLSQYRWAVYSAVAAAVDRKGLVGRSCVLKSICESAGSQFHYQNGILAELLHIVLSPSTSTDKISTHSDNEYFQAEVLGRSGAPCDVVFHECKRSLMDIFTNVLEDSGHLLI